MGLLKVFHEWQKSLEDLEDSFKHMNNRVQHMKECEDRGMIRGGMVFMNKSFEDLKKSSQKLADIVDKNVF